MKLVGIPKRWRLVVAALGFGIAVFGLVLPLEGAPPADPSTGGRDSAVVQAGRNRDRAAAHAKRRSSGTPEAVRGAQPLEPLDIGRLNDAISPTVVAAVCGNGKCETSLGEDPCNCRDDCGDQMDERPVLGNCTDGLDNDCDTMTDCVDPGCAGVGACVDCGDGTCDPRENPCTCPNDCWEPEAAFCGDGMDNDCDNLIDCADPDCCASPNCCGSPVCPPGSCCGNDRCDLGETLCSCLPSQDCGQMPAVEFGFLPPQIACHDNVDNDCDNLIDCADPDCCADPACCGTPDCPPPCPPPTCGPVSPGCDPGEDPCNCPSDCTGTCCGNTLCQPPEEDSCNCPSDCGGPPPGGCCGNDRCDLGETLCSCLPSQDCGQVPAVEFGFLPPQIACHDNVDNDCDNLIDCADPDCCADPACCGTPDCPPPCPPPTCGPVSPICDPGEDPCNCPSDCTGTCCGNTLCQPPEEDSCNCPSDCGGPPPGGCCGNDRCDLGETLCSCLPSLDCGQVPAVEFGFLPPQIACHDDVDNDCDNLIDCADPDCCADPECCGTPDCPPPCPPPTCGPVSPGCDLGEDPCNCPSDCGGPCCGDFVCQSPDEDPCTCPSDCGGSCCGNNSCEPDETSCTCPSDCQGPCCGDGVCEPPPLEDPCTCPSDCGGPCCGDGTCDAPVENPCTCASDCRAPEAGFCADGMDNDCDGAVDCADADCSGDPACAGACCDDAGGACTDGIPATMCPSPGLRYGGDGSTCATISPACSGPAVGACCNKATATCTDGVSEPACTALGHQYGGDGSTCAGLTPPCGAPFCGDGTCDDPVENPCTCASDCGAPEAAFCSDGMDNDCDGCTDALDSECGGTETVCDDGLDNDCDGATDCADSACECPKCWVCDSGTNRCRPDPMCKLGNSCATAEVTDISITPLGADPLINKIAGANLFTGVCGVFCSPGDGSACGGVPDNCFPYGLGGYCAGSSLANCNKDIECAGPEVCLGDCFDSPDRGFWEGIRLSQSARVTIHFCQPQDRGTGPDYVSLARSCEASGHCGPRISADFWARGEHCTPGVNCPDITCPEDPDLSDGHLDNLSMTFLALPAGTYWYPILSSNVCKVTDTTTDLPILCEEKLNDSVCPAGRPCVDSQRGNFILTVVAEELPIGACCDCEGVCSETDQATCFTSTAVGAQFSQNQRCGDVSCLPRVPANDECLNKEVIPVGTAFVDFDNHCATRSDVEDPAPCQNAGLTTPFGADIWYNYIAECTGTLTVSMCAADGGAGEYDGVLAVYNTCICGELGNATLADCDDDECGGGVGTASMPRVQLPVSAGQCYKIRVGGYNGHQGPGRMAITCAASCTTDADCDDVNTCTTDRCVRTGTCSSNPAISCTGDADCPAGDTCVLTSGTCQHDAIPNCCLADDDCSDGNACTSDTCVQSRTCVGGANTGNPCTVAADCPGGQCVSDPVRGACVYVTQFCDEGDVCTSDTCIAAGTCASDPATVCTGNSDCPPGDICENIGIYAICQHSPIPGCCVTNAACFDGNNCTDDVCQLPGTCSTNTCVGGPNSGVPCVTDGDCGPGSCLHNPIVPCCSSNADCPDDGDFCNGQERCVNGVCTSAGNPCSDPTPVCCTTTDPPGCVTACCGNGTVEGGEECDGPEAPFCPLGCDSNCRCVAMCGDGILDPGEECDRTNDAACPGLCQSGCTCPTCAKVLFDPPEIKVLAGETVVFNVFVEPLSFSPFDAIDVIVGSDTLTLVSFNWAPPFDLFSPSVTPYVGVYAHGLLLSNFFPGSPQPLPAYLGALTVDTTGAAPGSHLIVVDAARDGDISSVYLSLERDPLCGGARVLINAVQPCVVDADCDDGDFCNGREFCDPATLVCASGPAPCPDPLCCETTDSCAAECCSDADCPDDGDFCNGQERCVNGVCTSAGNPCSDPTPVCCSASSPPGCAAECCSDAECDDGAFCTQDSCDAFGICANTYVYPCCGNGISEPSGGEQCDDTDDNNCPGRCDANCQCIGAGCGNGTIDPGETCDDGNAVDNDACRNNCTKCGDGVLQPASGEECDPPNGVTCDNDCQLIPFCGDGVINSPGETCDGADPGTSGCTAVGSGQPDACRRDCTCCGDGIRQDYEPCDGDLFEPDAPPIHGACRSDCTYCGDGLVATASAAYDGASQVVRLVTGDPAQINAVVAGTPPTAILAVTPVNPPVGMGTYPPGTTIVDNTLSTPFSGGFRAWFNVQLSNWDPNGDNVPALKVYQIKINCAGYDNGIGAPLATPVIPCTVDAAGHALCRDEFGEDWTRCEVGFGYCTCASGSVPCVPAGSGTCTSGNLGNACTVHADCDGDFCKAGYLDKTGMKRPADNWCAEVSAGSGESCDAADVATGLGCNYNFFGIYGATRKDNHIVYYGGTLVLDIPPGAKGLYCVGLDHNATFLADTSSPPIDIGRLQENGFCVDIITGCGNEVVDAGEQCDGTSASTCPSGICNPDCTCFCTAPSDCNDGIPCTNDACVDNACVHINKCDDGLVCTDDRCHPVTGQCIHPPRNCNDSNPCTVDSCDPTAPDGCVPILVECDDGVRCTTDSCDPNSGCQYAPDDSKCDDEVACTRPDCCDPSDPSADADGCVHYPDNGYCETQNVCAKDFCDPNYPDADPLSGCAQKDISDFCVDDDLCTEDRCDPGNGCSFPPINCADNNPCTADVCKPELGCRHVPDPDCTCVTLGYDCDDGNYCTKDFCEPGNPLADPFGCVHKDISGFCVDGNPCTVDGVCDPASGSCVWPPVDCEDGNLCTDDQCNPATGQCTHGPTNCNDLNACTRDSCEPATGCRYDAVVCVSDNNPCTQDTCVNGSCYLPKAPGTACGNPSDSQCDGRDTCDGAGNCQPNYVQVETSCSYPDPADSACTARPDSCDGAGACVENCLGRDDCRFGEACPDAAYHVAIVSAPCPDGPWETRKESTTNDPPTPCDAPVACGDKVAVEVWVTKYSAAEGNPGITCAFVNLESLVPTLGVDHIEWGESFDPEFRHGVPDAAGSVQSLGGCAFASPGVGVWPQWVLVARVIERVQLGQSVAFGLEEAVKGTSVYGQGFARSVDFGLPCGGDSVECRAQVYNQEPQQNCIIEMGDLGCFAGCWLKRAGMPGYSSGMCGLSCDLVNYLQCPGDPLDDWVGPEDFAFFVTGWMKCCQDPSIILPPGCEGSGAVSATRFPPLPSATLLQGFGLESLPADWKGYRQGMEREWRELEQKYNGKKRRVPADRR